MGRLLTLEVFGNSTECSINAIIKRQRLKLIFYRCDLEGAGADGGDRRNLNLEIGDVTSSGSLFVDNTLGSHYLNLPLYKIAPISGVYSTSRECNTEIVMSNDLPSRFILNIRGADNQLISNTNIKYLFLQFLCDQ